MRGRGMHPKFFSLKSRLRRADASLLSIIKYISKNFFRKRSFSLVRTFVYVSIARGVEDAALT